MKKTRRWYLFIGRPGAGKTTISEKFAQFIKAPLLKPGDILRDRARWDTSAKQALDAGEMAPPEVMDAIMTQSIETASRHSRYLVIDGYPRYWAQFVDVLFAYILLGVEVKFVHVRCNWELAILRLNERGRGDPDHRRMEIYTEVTKPFIEYLESRQFTQDMVINLDNHSTARPDDLVAHLHLTLPRTP